MSHAPSTTVKEHTRLLLEERTEIETACKIVLLAQRLGEHQCQGGVNQDYIRDWLDLYASECSAPAEALRVIQRHLKDFRASRFLGLAILDSRREVALL